MRRLLIFILIFGLEMGVQTSVRGESTDPSELFLSAYMAVQQGEKLERDGKFALALKKYKSAAVVLDQVHAKYPNWQPLIVDYRKKRTTENIAKIQQRIALEGN